MDAQRILAPVDFSDASRRALRAALSLAAERDSELTVVHVHPFVRAVFLEATFTERPEESVKHLREAEAAIAKELEAIDISHPKVTVEAALGDPTAVILDLSPQYDLIVMSSHGATGMTELLLGSVTERVVRGAKCSVFVVKEKP